VVVAGAQVAPAHAVTPYVYRTADVPPLAESESLIELALEPIAAPLFVHAHEVGVNPEQFAVSETEPPVLGSELGLGLILQLGELVPLLTTQVTCEPDTDTLLQPLKLIVTSARDGDE